MCVFYNKNNSKNLTFINHYTFRTNWIYKIEKHEISISKKKLTISIIDTYYSIDQKNPINFFSQRKIKSKKQINLFILYVRLFIFLGNWAILTLNLYQT